MSRLRAVEAFLVRHRLRFAWLQGAMAVAFLAVVVVPAVMAGSPLGDRLAGWAGLAMWGLWFPLVLVSVLFVGRLWCGMLCPMGAASEWVGRISRDRAVPAWLRWEGTPILSFVVVTLLGQTLGVRDHPEAVLEIFGGTMAIAILCGFLYGRRKRVWCRHACPIGLLLGVFSRLGAVEIAPKAPVAGGDAWTERGVCPTFIDLPRKRESRHCIQCMRCVVPKAKGGLAIRLRHPGAEIAEIGRRHPNLAEILFLFLGAGIALGGFLWLALPHYQLLRQAIGEWGLEIGLSWLGQPGPAWLMSIHPDRREVFVWLDFLMISGTMLATMMVFAALLAGCTALAALALGARAGRFADRFMSLGYQFSPVTMVSLLVGLGGTLLAPIPYAREVLIGSGLIWSLALGWRISAGHCRHPVRRAVAAVAGTTGAVAVASAWAGALLSS